MVQEVKKKKEANKPKTENEPDVPRLETLEPEKLARVRVGERGQHVFVSAKARVCASSNTILNPMSRRSFFG